MSVDPCPWLGTDEDRTLRHTEVSEAHRCYACSPPWPIDSAHQVWYCLTDRHRACKHYREPDKPPMTTPPPPLPAPETVEDEIGPAPRRISWLRVLFWAGAALMAAVVLYVYGSTILGAVPEPTTTTVAGVSPSPSTTATSSSTATLPPTSLASATYGVLEPTGTPTPYPGGAVYGMSPAAGAVGWVASDEARGNHLGDSFLYSGVYDGVAYHGIFQIDLSAVLRGATIHAAVLEVTGLDDRRLGTSGTWEVRILAREADANWGRQTYQGVHNANIQWTLAPALSADSLVVGETNAFRLPVEQLRDLEARLLDEHYTVSFRLDGPLAGDNSLYAWDAGYGPSSRGRPPRLLLSVGAAPQTPIPTGSPPPTGTLTPSVTPTATDTPEWFVVTSTPTPENAMTAAAAALQMTAWAEMTGTPTPLPEYVATATPDYVVVTRTPTPGNYATAVYVRGMATAHVILTGTPTPTPRNLATATSAPRPTFTPAVIWLGERPVTLTPTTTPVPTTPPMPSILLDKILFLSDRTGEPEVYVLDPATGRLGLVTAHWPYDEAKQANYSSSDGQVFAYVQNDSNGVAQIFVDSLEWSASWQVTFNHGVNFEPAVSPGGDKLAFVATEAGNEEIYVIGADGRGQVRLTFNQWEWDRHPTWSPDGERIVFWSNQDSGRKQLWIMNADGTGRRLLLDSPYNDWDPVWVR